MSRYDDDPEHYSDDGPHSHPCAHCKTPVECRGEWLQNHDGFPAVVCHVFHVCATTFLCEACARGICEDCGEPAVGVVEDADDASGYRGDVALCAECLQKRTAA